MSEADWTELDNSLSGATIKRGPTAGVTKPNGGGTHCNVYNSLATTQGVSGVFHNGTDFAPLAKGGDAAMAMQRAPSGGGTNFAVFVFIGLGGTDVGDAGYILGLADGNPAHIVLRKGILTEGLPDVAPGTQGILRRSTETVAIGTYTHLKLEMVVNGNGDVVLNCYKSDLGAHVVSTPTWVAIPGMDQFIDDFAGINSGSVPYTSGYIGHAFWSSDVTRRAYTDHFLPNRQL